MNLDTILVVIKYASGYDPKYKKKNGFEVYCLDLLNPIKWYKLEKNLGMIINFQDDIYWNNSKLSSCVCFQSKIDGMVHLLQYHRRIEIDWSSDTGDVYDESFHIGFSIMDIISDELKDTYTRRCLMLVHGFMNDRKHNEDILGLICKYYATFFH